MRVSLLCVSAHLLSNRCSSIDALQEVGISAADLNKIKASGISTVLGVQQCVSTFYEYIALIMS